MSEQQRRVLRAIADELSEGETGMVFVDGIAERARLTMFQTKTALRYLVRMHLVTRHGSQDLPSDPMTYETKFRRRQAWTDADLEPVEKITEAGWAELRLWGLHPDQTR